jgi:hypothetical protein
MTKFGFEPGRRRPGKALAALMPDYPIPSLTGNSGRDKYLKPLKYMGLDRSVGVP